jgi:hypothetical protein
VAFRAEGTGADTACEVRRNYDSTSCGSIWTSGVSGLGMEIHGEFEYSWFKDAETPSTIEWCNSSNA